MERVFPDSNTLYPISVADLTLRLADIALNELVWSEDLLAEVEGMLIEHKGLPPDRAAYFCDCIREAFPDGEIQRSAYEHLVGTRTGPDPDDHVHSAAAVGGSATVLLTSNPRDFPHADLEGVRRAKPDSYLSELLDAHPHEVLAVVEAMGTERRDPQGIDATLAALARAGLARFSERAAQLIAERS